MIEACIKDPEGKPFVAKRVRKMTPICYAKMVKALQEDDHNAHELAEITGLHFVTMSEYVRCLHREGCIHVVAWDTDGLGRDTTPIFRMGPGRDKKRRRMSDNEKAARHRAKKRAIAMLSVFREAA